MRGINVLAAAMALTGMALSIPGTALAANAAETSGGAGGSNAGCRVQIHRDSAAGVYDVTRELLQNGKCICRVSTGPSSQGGSAESAVSSIRLRQTCVDAPLASATTGRGLGTGVWVGVGLLAAGGLAAALLSGGSNSP